MKKLFLLLIPVMGLVVSCNNGTINEPFVPDQNVTSITEAQNALEKKSINRGADGQPINLNFAALAEDGIIIIPSGITEANTPRISINIGSDYNGTLTIIDTTGNNYSGVINITVTDTSNANITVNAPFADVNILGRYNVVNATVAPASLNVAETAYVATLNLLGGHAVILGDIDALNASPGTTYTTAIGQDKAHATIQEALDAANCAGVILPAGTYNENIVINKDFSFESDGTGQAIINATDPVEITIPLGPGGAVDTVNWGWQGNFPGIYINGAYTVTMENITVSSQGTTENRRVDGITLDGGANLTLTGVTVENIISAGTISGAQYGRGVTVYGNSTLTVTGSTFRNINKNAIHVMNGVANVSGSSFFGSNIMNVIGQNGVVFFGGNGQSSGSVTGSSFSDYVYDGNTQDPTSAAILCYGSPLPVVNVENVTYTNCDGELVLSE